MNNETVNIFHIDKNRQFSEEEAYDLLNLLIIITQKAKNKINALSGQVEYHKRNPHEAEMYQAKLNEEIQKWSEKVRRLGGIPLSLYKVKIQATEGGFFTWEFPSSELIYRD